VVTWEKSKLGSNLHHCLTVKLVKSHNHQIKLELVKVGKFSLISTDNIIYNHLGSIKVHKSQHIQKLEKRQKSAKLQK
jgi:hypothetical protein